MKTNQTHTEAASSSTNRSLRLAPWLFLLGMVPLVFCLVGCSTPLKQYWGNTIQSSLCNTNPFVTNHFAFSVIEFDDQGDMWDRRQFVRCLDLIRRLKTNGPVTLVTFVHGWKHDASPNSSNLGDFYQFVYQMSTNRPSSEKDRTYLGVYLGWRGNKYQYDSRLMRAIHWLPLQLSFYNRKDTAAQVAGVSCTEAILSLAAQTRGPESPDERSKVIIVGHSFGGLVVERAITQAMLGGILMNPKRSERRPPADLVLLVNPASEALVANKMITALKRNPLIQLHARALTNELQPWIVSVTSQGDWATRYAFPAGRAVPSLFLESFRPRATNSPASQRSLYLHTAPHTDRLITHHIQRVSGSQTNGPMLEVKQAPPKSKEASAAQQSNAYRENLNRDQPVQSITERDPAHVRDITTPKGHFVLKKRDVNFNESAYWIIRADKELLPDHNTIFTAEFYALAGAFLDISKAEPASDKDLARNQVQPVVSNP